MSFTVSEAGLGEMALGSTPMGLSEVTVTDTTDTATGVRYLDPVTRDYAQNDGVILKAGPARQRIIILVTTNVKTSLSVKGIRLPDKHDETTAGIVERDIRRELQVLVDEGAIALNAIAVRTRSQNVNGRLGIRIDYVDLTTNQEDFVNV